MKPYTFNNFHHYIVTHKTNNGENKLKYFFANNLKDLMEKIECWKRIFCIYEDNIISIEQTMEVK